MLSLLALPPPAPPAYLHRALNKIFAILDDTIEEVDRTHLYKVETISNEYVACAGVLNPHPEHACIAVEWAQVQRRLPLGL